MITKEQQASRRFVNHNWLSTSKKHVKQCTRCGCVRNFSPLAEYRYVKDGVGYKLVPDCTNNL